MIGMYISLGILISLTIDSIISYFVLKKYQDSATMKAEVKERVLQLFLYAEKLDLIGAEKMSYVASKIEDHVPGKYLDLVLNGRDLIDFLQEAYDEVFSRIKK